ncbi:proteasome ATPase [Arcanobacterium ihumii]|uniref:proteasome ATPase n=1 Tax=Arcanobacterium ihumii TaxID=2138162 RepID=UPI000F542BC5|nr:proteasome ATPase [Arcanobacterium ihumii]
MEKNEAGEIFGLQELVGSLEEKNLRLARGLQDARKRIQELSEQLEKLSQPPSSYATFISANHVNHTVTALVGSRKMVLNTASHVELGRIEAGQELLLNEQMVVVGIADYSRTGDIVTVSLVLGADRVLVDVRQGEEQILWLAGKLRNADVKVGDLLLADLRTGFALEAVERPDVEHLLLEEIPNVDYSAIGGLGPQIEQIRDSVELPFEQPELYREYGLTPPKGVLLYGPPGNGKTLIAKAVATSLARKLIDRNDSGNKQAYFLNIKGPQLLDKYVGETERQIREIFSRARDRAAHGIPVVIFFDEMEALFRTRGSGISSDVETTVVPQLLAEIDGVEKLNNVIVIGASNREDMIDPAILRPGRLDVKIKIERPTPAGAKEILLKYLVPALPLRKDEIAQSTPQEAVARMSQAAVDRLFTRDSRNRFLELIHVDGTTETIYIGDLVSGSMLASIVDRAKKIAIKDFLANGERGLATAHIIAAVEEELRENEDLSQVTNPEEWIRINGQARGVKIQEIRSLTNTYRTTHRPLAEIQNPKADLLSPFAGDTRQDGDQPVNFNDRIDNAIRKGLI